MIYSVSDSQLYDLNVLIDKGGHIPTDVSNALAAAQIAAAGNNAAALTTALNDAIAANKRSGKAWTDVQNWEKAVEESGEPPVTQPPPQGGSSPLPTTPNDSKTYNWGPVYANTPYPTVAGGDGDFSFSVSGGNAWFHMTVNDAVVIDGGMTPIRVRAGDRIVMKITTPANGGNGTYSLMKYGG